MALWEKNGSMQHRHKYPQPRKCRSGKSGARLCRWARPAILQSTSGNRFQNTDVNAAQTNGTLIADASGGGDFQFGIARGAGSINLTSLTFDAKKATAAASTRGYNVLVSVDGGPYMALGSANLVADRNSGFDNIVLPTTGAGFTGVSSVNFRINSTGGGVEYTNIAINGTVPEPCAWSLLGVAALAPLARRRRPA